MARLPRFDLSGVAQHVIQRGVDRQACFAADGDYLRYLQELGEAAKRFDCALHAYVLMTNHVHLLVASHETGATSQMMQALSRRYVAAFNARYHRTGTLWEGWFKAGLVDSDGYVQTCYRYTRLNPVRAGMVLVPEHYRWSSYAYNALATANARITPHSCYIILGDSSTTRYAAFHSLFEHLIALTDVAAIRAHAQQQRAWGSDRFRTQVEALTGRAASSRPRGQPWPARSTDD